MNIFYGSQYLPELERKEFVTLLPSLKRMKQVLFIWMRRKKYNKFMLYCLIRDGIWSDKFCNPAEHTGAALKIAEKMGIKIQPSPHSYGVLASIDDSWVDRFDVCMAICDLALAHKWGIKIKAVYTPQERLEYEINSKDLYDKNLEYFS